MRDNVRDAMRTIEDMDTFQIIEELAKCNPFASYTPREGRMRLAMTLLRFEHGPLEEDEGWAS